jgi:16S rRNA (cytosine967-C5)-methyltransferase
MVNTTKCTAPQLTAQLEEVGVRVQTHPWLDNCLYLSGTGDLERLSAFREGMFYVQDPASRLAIQAADPKPGMRVLDCCAAPGGKSFAAAILMKNQGEVISCDLHPHKKKLIQAGADRLGLNIIAPMTADGKAFRPEWEESFDLVLVDAPCSGLGVIRKKPDIRYKDPAQLTDLPNIQREILSNAARYVRPGGTLLYSTCTLLKRENEEVAQAFLARNAQFHPEAFSLYSPIGTVESGMVTLWPHRHGTDGFFICKLRKEE